MITANTIIWALAIFCLRICDVSLGTIRTVTIVRGWRSLAAAIGFVEATIFILVIERKNMPKFIHLVEDVDSGAFVTSEEMRHISRGYIMRADKKK